MAVRQPSEASASVPLQGVLGRTKLHALVSRTVRDAVNEDGRKSLLEDLQQFCANSGQKPEYFKNSNHLSLLFSQ